MQKLILALVALLVLALASPYAHAGPVLADENTIKMLRTYLNRYSEPDLSDYVVFDQMRSSKRGLGPRPLRFG